MASAKRDFDQDSWRKIIEDVGKRTCPSCGEEKTTSDFRSTRPDVICESCRRTKTKERYVRWKENRGGQFRSDTARENYTRVNELKLITPCADCDVIFHPAAMEFDHLPQYEKTASVSALLHKPWPVVEEEIQKCEIVCANCHRVRTWKRHFVRQNKEGGG